MRVTNEMMIGNSLHRLSSRLQQYERTQSQLATGKRIMRPSDDPSASSKALGLRSSMRAREQEGRNATDALAKLNLADSQMQSATTRLSRVRDLAVRAANEASGSEREAIAQEIEAIQQELLAIANTRNGNSALFGGFSDGEDKAVVRRDNDGNWEYLGDDGVVERRVGEQDRVQVNVTARELFGFDPDQPGTDLFSVLDGLVGDLRANDQAAISGRLDDLDVGKNRIGSLLGRVGAATNWVDSAASRGADAMLSIRSQLAEAEDVDITEAIMDLQVQEVAYEATLAALGRALPQSLSAFLR